MSRPEYAAIAIVDDLDHAAAEFEREARQWKHPAERMTCERWARHLRAACTKFEQGHIDHDQAVAFAVAGLQLVGKVRALRRLIEGIVWENPPLDPEHKPGRLSRRHVDEA